MGQVNIQENEVEAMFNGIAPRYDFLNHLLSFGIDKIWRKRLVKTLVKRKPLKVLDVATGTGDLAITLANKQSDVTIVGVDIAQEMLAAAKQKVDKLHLSNRISFQKASSLSLPFLSNQFDAAMVAFGVRNFEDPLAGLTEICRVLKPGASFLVLEFTNPQNCFIRSIYSFYFKTILPKIGSKISGHKTAYTYLPQSVGLFKEREGFVDLLKQSGFTNAYFKQQSFGVAAIYIAKKA
ncbi:MAG: bifunctional demethylmenaquinone methyltransferase/2-methoxy-6-polyprenyl-1,4-benzoquinol methylase UbiE [Bacteroidales bacterium]|nr:bifunctional demethylmenaquinone methyltransferase/2-methoxy-6-polyprenyl-1,4-benzoquinol methylase UbiE [Tenuifilaceae bacterium]